MGYRRGIGEESWMPGGQMGPSGETGWRGGGVNWIRGVVPDYRKKAQDVKTRASREDEVRWRGESDGISSGG